MSVVTGFTITRGRSYMLDRIDAGTASITFTDTNGLLDPTNTGSPNYPMNPNSPAVINIRNPVTGNFKTLFTGFVQSMPTQINVESVVNNGSLELADLFALLARMEVPPGLDFDDSATGASAANTSGNTTYAATDVQSRIKAILADAGVPSSLTDIFTGNVNVQFTVESPGTKILAALQDAADAEFPGVANIYMSKDGIVTFHGRKARFNPTDPQYGITTWHAGDTAAVNAHSTWALLNSLTLDRDIAKIINAAMFTPQGISDAALADASSTGLLQTDTGSITTYGPNPISGSDLLTAGGLTDGLDANDEVQLFNQYYVDNFHDAQTRVQQAVFRSLPPSHPNAAGLWNLLCNVELNDIVEITTTHPGGGGFNAEPYFVEKISYQTNGFWPPATGETEGIWDLTLTLDLSPKAYFTTEPVDWENT